MKQGGSADEGIRAGMSAIGCCFKVHAAVHADVIMQMPVIAPLPRLLYFRQGLIDKRLSAESRVNGHNQERVNLLQIGLNGRNCRRGIDCQADLFAQRFYFPHQRRYVIAKLDMNVHLVCSGFGKWFE